MVNQKNFERECNNIINDIEHGRDPIFNNIIQKNCPSTSNFKTYEECRQYYNSCLVKSTISEYILNCSDLKDTIINNKCIIRRYRPLSVESQKAKEDYEKNSSNKNKFRIDNSRYNFSKRSIQSPESESLNNNGKYIIGASILSVSLLIVVGILMFIKIRNNNKQNKNKKVTISCSDIIVKMNYSPLDNGKH
ncbi:hypothetical protein PIROE2DRAFT_19392 [Piromyces sp. E2]|nr:hypothetical protein PIROE2DRAFT_19392 [Piromyces sp. E2]|eukprot:OUM56142.1 hypothetical protein PIROE2DRAFT_19392 [Piromyces sp. E2]